ncbi:fibrous sheath-interacting protein 2 [Tenrec ecaudatus]|uniref:fibrous sheath-interacting protein 2 n=1 Tax=Tenrec ecaudatus TaxID=94439 RepID=UPI003F599E65
MELYLSSCSKVADTAANKTATMLAADSQQCGDGAHKTHLPGIGAAQLLDLPLGVKLPVIPGSNTVFYTTGLCEKLFRPSYDFNLTDPYCRLLENQYKSLHDPHLRAYYKRKDILRRLKKGGYITSNNKIVCSLKEWNKYRQYLTSLKLDFERNYSREQKMLTKRLNKLQENCHLSECCHAEQFQNWLLQERAYSFKDQERLIRHRYLDMIRKELELLERTAEEQRLLQRDKEERRQREHTRRKLNLRRKIEEEWKEKEMLLLTKIGEDAKREAKIEEQRRRSREESDRKKQALLEKKMAHHLQKIQELEQRREDIEKNTVDRGQDGTQYEAFAYKKKKNGDGKSGFSGPNGVNGFTTNNASHCQRSSLNLSKRSATSVLYPPDTQDNGTEQKTDGTTTYKSNNLYDKGVINVSAKPSGTSAHSSPTRKYSKPFAPDADRMHEVTAEELNSIIQNIMTWVVATVTSILYPAITKYEERLRSSTYPVSEDSLLSSESSSFCSTCSEGFTYGSYTSTFQTEPYTLSTNMSVRPPHMPSARMERTQVEKTYHRKRQSGTSDFKYNNSRMIYEYPGLRSCKSDSHLLASSETSTKISKDATTETDSLEYPSVSDRKAKAINEIKNLKNVFVNFKCHLKGETELILESILQELMSDLTQAIPSLSSVTAEVFVDRSEASSRDLLSNVDICSVAGEIVDNMLEKLQSAVEKKCVEIFSQEDLSVHTNPDATSGQHFTSSNEKPLEAPQPHSVEPMCNVAEDVVHSILEKLMALASCKQKELPHLENKTKQCYQQPPTDSTPTFLQRVGQKKPQTEPDTAKFTVKEEIQNLVAHIFSKSSLVGYIEEAVGAILGYVQDELNNERLIASEETVLLLQLLDNILAELHPQSVKPGVQKNRPRRPRPPANGDERYRFPGSRPTCGHRSGKPFSPINVPGMVLYPEDENEEIDKIVKNVLDSSFQDERANFRKQTPDCSFKNRNTCFEHKTNAKVPRNPAAQGKVVFGDCGLKLDFPSFNNEDHLWGKSYVHEDVPIFSPKQKHQIQKTSEKIVKSILTEMLTDISCFPPGPLDRKTGKEASVFASRKPPGVSHQEWMDQMFSVSEIRTMTEEITDAVLNILYKASSCITNTTEDSLSSSVHQTSLDNSDASHMAPNTPNKKPLQIWFDSEKKMKYLSSIQHSKPSSSEAGKRDSGSLDNINDTIVSTVVKKLKAFVCPKLQLGIKSSPTKPSPLRSQLSDYTTKVVNIVLHAIQNELEFSMKNLNPREADTSKSLTDKGVCGDSDQKLESLVTSLSDDMMTSPLLTCICDMLSSQSEAQRNILLPPDEKPGPATSYRSHCFGKQTLLPNRQDKPSTHKCAGGPCTQRERNLRRENDVKENARLQVLDSIGETLYEMLCKLLGARAHAHLSCSKNNREKPEETPPATHELHSNIQLISKTILESIIAKLCDMDTDNFVASGLKTVSECLDIDSSSFSSITEEMAKCTDIISQLVSGMFQKGNKETPKCRAKPDSVASKAGLTGEGNPKKLKAVASDILNMVFDNLERFANGNLETLGTANGGNKNTDTMDWGGEDASVSTDVDEELLQSALFIHAKNLSNALLKAIQTELNGSSLDLRADVKRPSPEKQIITETIDLILDAVSSDIFQNEIESEEDKGMGTYRYRPTYGNYLPGGAEPDSFLEDAERKENEGSEARPPPVGESESDSLKQRALEKALSKIEVELREPQTSPIVPIIKNILNEIFHNAFLNQVNRLPFPQSPLSSILHNVDETVPQTSGQATVEMMDSLVSEADVTSVTDDVIRTVFHKLYSAALSERNASKKRFRTITFSANVSFHEHTSGGKPSVTVLEGNPGALHPRTGFGVDGDAKVNVIEEIIQAVLTNLETFATSKVKSLFCSQLSFTVLPMQQDKDVFSQVIPTKDPCYDESFFSSSVDQIGTGKALTVCELPLSKLNNYATEVARKILQGLKHELDKEVESPVLTHQIIVSESIASQVVNTVLDIVSSKSRYEQINSKKEIDSYQQESIMEKLFNKAEYRKILKFQLQVTIENILSDIYEKTLDQNNLTLAISLLKCNIDGRYSETNSEMFTESSNKARPKLSVPKSDVIRISNDIVDIVLNHLSRAVAMLGIHAEASTPERSSLTLCNTPPNVGCRPHVIPDTTQEINTENVLFSGNAKSSCAVDNKITVAEKEESSHLAPDPCAENANFITKIIFNSLESFATDRIDSLIPRAFQPKEKLVVSPELENCKQDDRDFCESSQVESGGTIFSQQFTDSTFASYRENLGPTIHLSQACLKEYADIIASVILKLIKNDVDLEIQRTCSYPNRISLQENIIVSEVVNSILKIIHNKRSAKETCFYSKKNTKLASQLTMSNEIQWGQKKDTQSELSPFPAHLVGKQQRPSEEESQRTVLEEIFMRNEEPRKTEKTELIIVVEEVLKKVSQRVMKAKGRLSPNKETLNLESNSKVQTSDATQKNSFQSSINRVATDIVECVLEEIHAVVVKCLRESSKWGAAPEPSYGVPPKPSCFGRTRQAGQGSVLPRYGMRPMGPRESSQDVSFLENPFLQGNALQVGKDLFQMVLNKIKTFASQHLGDSTYKVSPKDGPKPDLKANLKARAKMTSLSKFRIKSHPRPSGAKVKNKTKLPPGDNTPRCGRAKTVLGLPHSLSTGDAKNILEIKLPTSELKGYSQNIICSILEAIVKEFEKFKQDQATVNIQALPLEQITEARGIVSAVLQGLYATNNQHWTRPIKASHLDDLKRPRESLGADFRSKPQACFFLENVSSQLEQIFPKEGIFKKMFDKWQIESNDPDNETFQLLMVAETILTEISIKAKELEYSVSLLNLPPLEASESRFNSHSQDTSKRTVDFKAQINMFAREIVEMLFEKLQMCFLTQLSISECKDTRASGKEHIGVKVKHVTGNVAIENLMSRDRNSLDCSHRVVREIAERVLNMLESFVDLQFKHISKYEFSEIVKMPIESFFPVQQRLLSKKMWPKLQPVGKFSDEPKSAAVISKENVENIFLQVHVFHSELLTYATNIISDMLGIIKNKLDKEISEEEPASDSSLKENIIASEIIGTLIDRCAHFNRSLIEYLPKENTFQGVNNVYIVNQVELSRNLQMSASDLEGTSSRSNPPQVSAPGVEFYSEDDKKKKHRPPSNQPTYVRYVGNTIQSSELVGKLDSNTTVSLSRNTEQSHSYVYYDQAMRGKNAVVPGDSVLNKLFKKANESTETALQQAMSFIEKEKSGSPGAFHYKNLQPAEESTQIETSVSPLKICLAAENIVNTVLSSYGFPSQPHTEESMETIKPFFMSHQSPLSGIPEEETNEEENLLRMWDKKINCMVEEDYEKSKASRDFPLLQKWGQNSVKIKRMKSLEDLEVIAFADHELGPNEIYLIARHVTRSVITHFKNVETIVSSEEMISIVSTSSRKKYESKQPIRNIHNNSSLGQFCEQLTELVILQTVSRVFEDLEEDTESVIAWESQVAFNKIISIHSHVFESRSIPITELALSITEIIIQILSNSNIIMAEITQQMTSRQTKYTYCPGVTATDFDDLFQDLLIGVIHILSKEIGINGCPQSNGRNNSFSMLSNPNTATCNKVNGTKRQTEATDSKLPDQIDQFIQKNNLNDLACKLDSLVGSLKTHESKDVVRKVFNILLDTFLPEDCPDVSAHLGKVASFPCPNNQEDNSAHGNNLGLSPKSVFLLNVICEKLIRTLLEKYTGAGCLDSSGPFSDEAERCQLFKMFESVEGEEVHCQGASNRQPFQEDYMSDFLENLAEIDQDSLSSDSMLTVLSHSLVKSLMDKLSHGSQHASESSPFANMHQKYGARIEQSSFPKAPNPKFTELQDRDSIGFVSFDKKPLRTPLNNSNTVTPKIQAPFSKQYPVRSPASPLIRQGGKKVTTTAIDNVLHSGGKNVKVYSATFLEEIILQLFCNLSTSLLGTNENITEAALNERNAFLVKSVVNEFNNSQVTVLRNAEERLCFPPTDNDTVGKIVDTIYNDILQHYKLKASCSEALANDDTSIAEQITNGILLEILDYQLPPYLKGNLKLNAFHPLEADIILQKLQSRLKEFTSQRRFSTDYSTLLSHSQLEDVIRKLLVQLVPPASESFSLGKEYLMSSDVNKMSNCIISKVLSAISKHKIWLTLYDNHCLHPRNNLQKMVDSVYSNVLQMSDSLVSIQKSLIHQSPVIADRIAGCIIQEIIENHLQPFLSEESLPRPQTPLDEISNMVKNVLLDVTEAQGAPKPPPLAPYPDAFVEEIVGRLLSKIFISKSRPEVDLEKMTQKIVNSINDHFDKAKINTMYDDKEPSRPSVDTDTVDKLVTSVYRNVVKQHELDPDNVKGLKDNDIFVDNIANLIVAALSDYLLHPLLSGDLPDSPYSTSMAENIAQDILSSICKSTKPGQGLSPYNTLLPYTFLEDMIRVLLSRIFPSTYSMIPNKETPKERSAVNFNEVASNLISDIRMKISQHEIRFSKEEDETSSVYSESDVQNLVDSVFKNISQNSASPDSIGQNITNGNDVFIDKIAGFIIKSICQQHLQAFVDGGVTPAASWTYSDDERRQLFYSSVYSSRFLEDVISGVLSKVFHRLLGIVQSKSVRDLEDELLERANQLIPLIIKEFSNAQVSIIENAEDLLALPPVDKDAVVKIVDTVYSKVLQEYEMELMSSKGFLTDTKALAVKITGNILTEIFDFQIHPDIVAKLPYHLHSKLSADTLINRVKYDIRKSRLRKQSSTTYTTMLSHNHLKQIVTQLISQISSLASSMDNSVTSQSDLSNTVMKLINEIMSIISKHAICIIKHGGEKQSMISENDIQSMIDSIYGDLSYSDLYQSLTKDKKGISDISASKIASFIIKEIFNHHLQSFVSADKTPLSAAGDQTYKQKAIDSKQRELSSIVNSAVFLEEVISELLCKILYAFPHDVLAAENPDKAKAKTVGTVTTLVESIVLEFTTSEILLVDDVDENLCFTEGYKEMAQNMVNLIYEKILDEYKTLIQVHKAIQSDTMGFGRKIYHFLLGEIYDYQMQTLVSGDLAYSSYSFPKADNIIKKVLHTLLQDSEAGPSFVTVLPHSLLRDMIYKLLMHMFPLTDLTNELKDKEGPSDCEFVNAATKLTDEIIKEIFEHEIRLATAEENAETMQVEVIENLVDSICNNILKKSEFQAEVKKDARKIGGSFLSKIAGLIIKEIMDHHLKPFLSDEESSASDLTDCGHVSPLAKSDKAKSQPSLYSATFLEDVIVDLVRKFYSLQSVADDAKEKEMPESDIVSLAIEFANSLIEEFSKCDIKVLPNAEKIFSFPPIAKETIDTISNFVYDQFIGKYGSSDIQKDDKSHSFIESIASLVQKAISAFKIQPLFSGDWFSTFFSFLNPDNITQRVQHLPQDTAIQAYRCLEGNQLTLPEESHKHTTPALDQKNTEDTTETEREEVCREKIPITEEKSMQKAVIDPTLNSVNSILKSNMVPGVASQINEHKGKMETAMEESLLPKVPYPSSIREGEATRQPGLLVTADDKETGSKSPAAAKVEEGPGGEIRTHFIVATDVTQVDMSVPRSDFETDHEKKSNKTRERLSQNDGRPPKMPSFIFNAKNKEITIENILTQKLGSEGRRDVAIQAVTNDEHYVDGESVQNVTENIYENVLELYSQEQENDLKSQSSPGDKALHITQEFGKDSVQSVSTRALSSSIIKNVPAKEREEERAHIKEMKSEAGKEDSLQFSPENKPRIIPASFLEDVIMEMINKLIFSSPQEAQTYDHVQNETDGENPALLYDTAMKLMDSLLKEFSDAQIKVFRPEKKNQICLPASKVSLDPKVPPKQKEPTSDKASSSIMMITADKIAPGQKPTKESSTNKLPFIDKMPALDKALVNKVVHSSICKILKEYQSQDSICKNINTDREFLARRLTSAVIDEIFHQQLNLVFGDEVPASACLPLQSKDVVKKIQKVAHTANKECQTSSPYTIMLPHRFLEDVISSLLYKIFPTDSNTKTEAAENNFFTELDFLQLKLVSTVMAKVAKDEDMIIQYVESLHPNDDEIAQLVVQSIYNNLLPQFGSQEIIQNCVTSGCRILSDAIVDLVLREVAGNQLQNYFSGELTPCQCAEIDCVVEDILQTVVQTTDGPHPPTSHAHRLSCSILEDITVKFLSKLFSKLPKVNKGRTKSLEMEMQNISSKILNSVQEFISKSQIKLTRPAKESPTIPCADNATIENVVNSVYTRVLNLSGSHNSVFKDLLSKSSVLSDIIGCLMVKEISNSEFQPQVEEELSNSELVLEAVKIMEKVIGIINEMKSQEKPLSRKGAVLDALFVEETLALFLAKLIGVPSASINEKTNISKPELNKLASQLTKSVTAEISKSNISLVAADPEEHPLNQQSTEMVSQVVDSVYSNVLQQSGSQENLFHEIRDTNKVLPQKVANLIVHNISNFPLNTSSPKYLSADFIRDLDTDRIVQKAQTHSLMIVPEVENEGSYHCSTEEFPVKIVPHIKNKPISIDPAIISEHLAVLSVKTQPLEKIKMDCLKTTGHTIAELRRASLSGKSYSSTRLAEKEKAKKERRPSLNKTGRLDVKPFEAVGRNSFQNIRKPDLARVELLKDVQNKQDLIIRLVAHDLEQEYPERTKEESVLSDEDEVVLREVVQEGFLEGEEQGKEAVKPVASKAMSTKPTVSTSSLKKFLSLSKCCQPTSSTNMESIETTSDHLSECQEEQVRKAVAELDMSSFSVHATERKPPSREKPPQQSKEESSHINEPTHYFIHRIMSSSSYNQEDMMTSAGEAESDIKDPSAKILEESSQEPAVESTSSVKFFTIYEGRQSVLPSESPSKIFTSEDHKPSVSKQGSKMLAKVSSVLSKVFARTSTSISKAASSPPQNEP